MYTSVEPIYSLFDLNIDLPNYLLNEYQYIIEYNDENDNSYCNEDDNEDDNDNDNDNEDSWEKSFNDALLQLGNYLVNKDVKIS